jgi:hypothetical protein
MFEEEQLMADKEKSAELILKLYELRREEVMRSARRWFAAFHPESFEEVVSTAFGEHSAYFRMVSTYWDMACSFVNHGAVDEEMFNDANGEHVMIYAKLQPFLEQIRARGNPAYLTHLEKAVLRMPEWEQRVAYMREMSKRLASRAADAQKS